MDNCTILIADDEPRIRKGLSTRIDWESISCSVCAVSEDGEMALKDSLKYSPDIIISDINMPKMNGLDFCRTLHEQNQKSEIIILTGYDQFEYAQQAIEIGVKRFIVKPVENSELLEIVDQLAKDICNRKKQDQQISVNIQESERLKEKELILDLLNGQIDRYEYVRRNILIDYLQADKYLYCVLIISIDNPSKHIRKRRKELTLVEQRIQKHLDSELLQNTIINQQNKLIVPVFFKAEHTKDKLISSLEWIKRLIHSESGINLWIGVGEIKKSILEMNQSLSEARDSLARAYLLGGSGICEYEKTVSVSSKVTGNTINLEIDLYKSIQSGSVTDMKVILMKIVKKMNSIEVCRATTTQILIMSLRFLSSENEHPLLFSEGRSLAESVSLMQSQDLIIKRLEKLLTDICRTIGQLSYTKNYKRIEIIKKYIDNNLTEVLSLDSIGEYMNISSTYLSNIFKKETGENLSAYITRVRIERAKELLEDHEIKTYQVAYQSGFKDPNYFNAQFKKITGISPGEYQKSLR